MELRLSSKDLCEIHMAALDLRICWVPDKDTSHPAKLVT